MSAALDAATASDLRERAERLSCAITEFLMDAWSVPNARDSDGEQIARLIEAELAAIRAEAKAEQVHPGYGPCDALGPNGQCAECLKIAPPVKYPYDVFHAMMYGSDAADV